MNWLRLLARMPLFIAGFPVLTIAAVIPAKPTDVLQRVAVPRSTYEMGMGIAEFPPNASKTWHRAVGPEVCYVLSGFVSVRTAGAAIHTYYVGDSFRILTNLAHSTTAGPEGARVLAVWAQIPGSQFNFPMIEPDDSSAQIHRPKIEEPSLETLVRPIHSRHD